MIFFFYEINVVDTCIFIVIVDLIDESIGCIYTDYQMNVCYVMFEP